MSSNFVTQLTIHKFSQKYQDDSGKHVKATKKRVATIRLHRKSTSLRRVGKKMNDGSKAAQALIDRSVAADLFPVSVLPWGQYVKWDVSNTTCLQKYTLSHWCQAGISTPLRNYFQAHRYLGCVLANFHTLTNGWCINKYVNTLLLIISITIAIDDVPQDPMHQPSPISFQTQTMTPCPSRQP